MYTVKRDGKTRYAREIQIQGPSYLIYDGRKLSCGARAWLETNSPLMLIDECTFLEAREAA